MGSSEESDIMGKGDKMAGETVMDYAKRADEDLMNPKNFLKLGLGSNILRMITAPYTYRGHLVEGEGGDSAVVRCDHGHGDKCNLSHELSLTHDDDRDDLNYPSSQQRWIIGVIDRRDGLAKILDLHDHIFLSIQQLARHEEWGDPKRYDINIVVDANGGPYGMYTIMSRPKAALWSEEMEKVISFGEIYLEDMVEFCRPCHPGVSEHMWHPINEEVRAKRWPKKVLSKPEGSKPFVFEVKQRETHLFPPVKEVKLTSTENLMIKYGDLLDVDPRAACGGCEKHKAQIEKLEFELSATKLYKAGDQAELIHLREKVAKYEKEEKAQTTLKAYDKTIDISRVCCTTPSPQKLHVDFPLEINGEFLSKGMKAVDKAMAEVYLSKPIDKKEDTEITIQDLTPKPLSEKQKAHIRSKDFRSYRDEDGNLCTFKHRAHKINLSDLTLDGEPFILGDDYKPFSDIDFKERNKSIAKTICDSIMTEPVFNNKPAYSISWLGTAAKEKVFVGVDLAQPKKDKSVMAVMGKEWAQPTFKKEMKKTHLSSKIDVMVDGKVVGTIDNSLKIAEVSKIAKEGATCSGCKKYYPYAEAGVGLECWECINA